MPLEDIANPLLRLPEMRTSGATLLSHAGEKPSLRAGQRMLFGIVSPMRQNSTLTGRGFLSLKTWRSVGTSRYSWLAAPVRLFQVY
jgi:hypothetical protein